MPRLLDVRVNLHALLADRQAVGKITGEGVFLEALERSPVKYLPEVTDDKLSATVVKVGGAMYSTYTGTEYICACIGWCECSTSISES